MAEREKLEVITRQASRHAAVEAAVPRLRLLDLLKSKESKSMRQRLSDLKPAWRRVYRDHHLTPDNGGFPTDDFELMFTCPACGPPYRIFVRVGATINADNPRRWMAQPLPDGPDWPSRVTVTPSIGWETVGHGRRHPTCGFHGTISGGEVTWP